MSGLIGVDTGFFLALSQKDKTALALFESPAELVTSVLVLYELQKKLREGDRPRWREALADLERVACVIPLTSGVALKAGEIAHDNALPAGAALIIASLLDTGCRTIYTTDNHLKRLELRGVEIIGLPGSDE